MSNDEPHRSAPNAMAGDKSRLVGSFHRRALEMGRPKKQALFMLADAVAVVFCLFVAMALHYTPIGGRFLSPQFHVVLAFLADLGVLFLLFFIGLQIDLKDMRDQSGDIIWLTVLNTTVPFLMGMAVMLALGYGWLMAFVIGLTRMPTAEAVIVPILDEFKLIRTRVGELIIGAGVLDDVIEDFWWPLSRSGSVKDRCGGGRDHRHRCGWAGIYPPDLAQLPLAYRSA